MRTGKVYLRTDERLVPMIDTEYSAEVDLQKLLADYPDLLAGDQMNAKAPRRWLLVTREASIPDSTAGLHRWALDHLFLDQEAVPTLVEVKRSSDTRLRREVVGQMLDYAANIATHWMPGKIRDVFEEQCRLDGRDPDAVVEAFVAEDDPVDVVKAVTPDGFWQLASDHLESRRMRLLFVADVVPSELQRIIEFLNESMPKTEVLGVEVRQFVGAGRQTLVPRVIGQTVAAEDLKKRGASGDLLDEESFFDAIREKGDELEPIARDLLEWARSRGLRVVWSVNYLSPQWHHPGGGGYEFLFDVSRNGTVSVPFRIMARRKSFEPTAIRIELLERLSRALGRTFDPNTIEATAKFDLADLAESRTRANFLEVADWALSRIKEAGPTKS